MRTEFLCASLAYDSKSGLGTFCEGFVRVCDEKSTSCGLD